MAKEFKLPKGKTYEFKAAAGGAAQSKYDWDEWFSGKLILIERSDVDADGELLLDANGKPTGKRDYEVETNAMPGKIKHAARMRYKVCQVGRTNYDGTRLKDALVLQARDMTDDERQAEDLLRAEEKVENAEIRKKRKAKEAAKKSGATAPDANGSAAPTPPATAPATAS